MSHWLDTSKVPELPLNKHTETSLLIVMGTVSNKNILKCLWHCLLMYVFVCMRVCVYVCSLQSFCTRASEDFCILSLARITEENKHCLYYSNEYGLGNKLYNFPLTHTHRMPRVAPGNLWHLTLLAPNTAVLHCCLTPDPWPLETHNSYISHYITRSCSR